MAAQFLPGRARTEYHYTILCTLKILKITHFAVSYIAEQLKYNKNILNKSSPTVKQMWKIHLIGLKVQPKQWIFKRGFFPK